MSEFPHIYTTSVKATNEVFLELSSDNLPSMQVTPPKEFGGPDGYWNPEAFFSASISTCFILTYKTIARGKKLNWEKINVDVDAYLDKSGNRLSFNRVDIFVTLTIPATEESKVETYQRALEKAEEACLITNSIHAAIQLHAKVEAGPFKKG